MSTPPGPPAAKTARVLLAALVGALAIVVLNAIAVMESGWSVRVLAVAAGILGGVLARAADRGGAERAKDLVGVICGATVVVGDLAIGAVAVGDATAVLGWQTFAWGAAAGFLARLVADGFEPLGLLTGTSSARLGPGKEHLRGTLECPACGSLQTEPEDTDMVTGAPRGMVCNACDHRFDLPAAPPRAR
ncbi:MAG: hypothetical protein KC635_20785 [Myxococcales bacterium]|nr:hypothetical protein [Myxococcales bacterium]MCB9735210.1 hypothetical protein [Deltaproteobacteria bacterium]